MQDLHTKSSSQSACNVSGFTSGSVTLVLDAPRKSIAWPPGQLPANFRSMHSLSVSGNNASGSAQYSLLQLRSMQTLGGVQLPLVVVDLRQESHGFIKVAPALLGEEAVAVGWFAERDWINVAKGFVSIEADEFNLLRTASQTPNLNLYEVCGKTTEDGIATATQHTVQPAAAFCTEQNLLTTMCPGVGYLRLPTTDHCRPRDSEVDRFVAFETALPADTWLHFHCRGGDGRTTIFMAMHDIIHNAPADSLCVILTRQKKLGGVDLCTVPTSQESFAAPFAVERVAFMRNFYQYVADAKPGGFTLTWSAWVTRNANASVIDRPVPA